MVALSKSAGAKPHPRAGGVTLSDVAALAGVAPITASRALRAAAAVSPALRQRVQEAAQRLGYVRNRIAGGLAGAQNDVVGVVVPSMHNAFFSATLEALSHELRRHDVSVIVGNTGYDPAEEAALVEVLLSWRPRGIVLTGIRHAPQVARLLRASSVPVIEMWELSRRPIGVSVGFSHRRVGASVARHFAKNGYRSLAFVGANLALDHRARERCAGFVAEVRRLGLAAPLVLRMPGRAEIATGIVAARAVLAANPRIDAAAFSNDVLALGALFECQRLGEPVPRRLALAGFGNLEAAAHATPRITSVAPPSARIGEVTGQAVFDESLRRRQAIDLGFELIERETSAP